MRKFYDKNNSIRFSGRSEDQSVVIHFLHFVKYNTRIDYEK